MFIVPFTHIKKVERGVFLKKSSLLIIVFLIITQFGGLTAHAANEDDFAYDVNSDDSSVIITDIQVQRKTLLFQAR